MEKFSLEWDITVEKVLSFEVRAATSTLLLQLLALALSAQSRLRNAGVVGASLSEPHVVVIPIMYVRTYVQVCLALARVCRFDSV